MANASSEEFDNDDDDDDLSPLTAEFPTTVAMCSAGFDDMLFAEVDVIEVDVEEVCDFAFDR